MIFAQLFVMYHDVSVDTGNQLHNGGTFLYCGAIYDRLDRYTILSRHEYTQFETKLQSAMRVASVGKRVTCLLSC